MNAVEQAGCLDGVQVSVVFAAQSQNDGNIVADAGLVQHLEGFEHIEGGDSLVHPKQNRVAAGFHTDVQVTYAQLPQFPQLLRRLTQHVVDAGIHRKFFDVGHEGVGHRDDFLELFAAHHKGVLSQQEKSGLVRFQPAQHPQVPFDLRHRMNLELILGKVAEQTFAPAASQRHLQAGAALLLRRTVDLFMCIDGGINFLPCHIGASSRFAFLQYTMNGQKRK